MKKGLIIAFWVLFVAGVLSVFGLFTLIAKGKIGYMPPVEDLQNPIDKFASQIISSDSKLLGTYNYSKDNRIYVNYKDLSPYLVNALIATEDVRFAEHSGVDAKAVARAVVKYLILQDKSGGGGSTITQQLAKQLYSPSADNKLERALQKPIEWVIAVQLERFYTKEEIINMYLNKFDFLNNAVGIQSAARAYFDTTPKNLKIEEAATLVGMCKNPSYFNPKTRNERTRGRRNVVLEQMYKAGYISKVEKDSLQALPLKLNFRKIDHKDGLAPYFREHLRLYMTAKEPQKENYRGWQMQKFKDDSIAWATDPLYGWCNKNKLPDGTNYNLYTSGLKIYTTLNSKMQKYAEDAMQEHFAKTLQPQFDREKRGRRNAPFSNDITPGEADTIIMRSMAQTDRYRALIKSGMDKQEAMAEFKKPIEMRVFSWNGVRDTMMSPWDSIRYHKSFLRGAFMAMNPKDGQVKAYVGGIDYNYFQYDMVSDGRRQVGSTIKPFLYSLAMENGYTPCDQTLNVQPQLVDENGILWAPKNESSRNVGEMVTLKWGLQNSNNWITGYLMKQFTPYAFKRLLESYGMQGHIDPVVSMCMGTPDISVREMVGAYTAFANKGIRVEPLIVTHIEDGYGNTIATFSPRIHEVLSEEASFKMLDMLQGVIDGGTGGRVRRIYNIKAPMGGKTGTTQNNSDGWFIGFTPDLAAGAWVGGEERSVHFDRTADGQGASMALPIYGEFFKRVFTDKELGYSDTTKFVIPEQYADPCSSSRGHISTQPNEPSHIDDIFN